MKWLFLTLAGAAAMTAGLAQSKPLRDVTGPAETPPASYSGSQYVDSEGCVFVRAGYAGNVVWVPRVTRERMVVCGYTPTGVPAAPAPVAPAETAAAPAPAPAAPKTPQKVAAAPAAPKAQKAAAPEPKAEAPDEAQTVTLTSVSTISSAMTSCATKSVTAERYVLSDGRTLLRCGDPVRDPVAYLNRLGLKGLRVTGTAPAASGKPAEPAPATTTAEPRTAAAAPTLPPGYKPAWDDGRLNPARGQGTAKAAEPAKVAAQPAPAPESVAPAATASGSVFIQVGVFSVAANADAAASKISGLSLGTARKPARAGGKAAEMVLAGPFPTAAAAREALARLRGAGFPDAFIR